jgi:hypothetical protein
MKKVFVALAVTATAASLSGCALLYPNWGTDQNPSTSMSPSATVESPSASPSESASETPKQTLAEVSLIDMGVDSGAGSLYVVAEVLNATEDGGKCTITFKSGSATKTVSVKAEANASTTQCFPAYLPIGGLPKGKGVVTITYESEKFFGTSDSYGVTIP